MRMEELSDNRYEKSTDSVEKYLLNIVQEYFKKNNIASASSREYIIKKAVDRMKEEMNFEEIGVLSITLPDGIKRTGAVNISLEELGGEPIIPNKLSAFNVSFGDKQNTACEGNDPRLSDKRNPLPHEHQISDVAGLEGILSTLTGKVERVDGFVHKHSNQSVLDLITYTGNKSKIDLDNLDTIENEIKLIIKEIQDDISKYKTEINNKIYEINTTIQNTINEIQDVKQYILNTNEEYYENSKTYTDEQIATAKTAIENAMQPFVKKETLSDIIDIASNVFTLVGTSLFEISTLFLFNTDDKIFSTEVDISSSILDELTARNQTIKDCQIELLFQYEKDGIERYSNTPYFVIKDTVIDGSLQVSIVPDNKLYIYLESNTEVPDYIQEGKIILKVYSKKTTTL